MPPVNVAKGEVIVVYIKGEVRVKYLRREGFPYLYFNNAYFDTDAAYWYR